MKVLAQLDTDVAAAVARTGKKVHPLSAPLHFLAPSTLYAVRLVAPVVARTVHHSPLTLVVLLLVVLLLCFVLWV